MFIDENNYVYLLRIYNGLGFFFFCIIFYGQDACILSETFKYISLKQWTGRYLQFPTGIIIIPRVRRFLVLLVIHFSNTFTMILYRMFVAHNHKLSTIVFVYTHYFLSIICTILRSSAFGKNAPNYSTKALQQFWGTWKHEHFVPPPFFITGTWLRNNENEYIIAALGLLSFKTFRLLRVVLIRGRAKRYFQ